VSGTPRPAVASLPAYRPGRSAEVAMAEHHLDRAIKLASNELGLPPLPSVQRAIDAAIADGSRYADHRATELRVALADSLGVQSSNVAVGCGSVGLLQQFALTYLDPDDPVVFGWPSFEAYPVYSALVAARAVRVPLRRQTLDTTAIAAAVDDRTKLILLASPNNPTGTAVSTAELVTLLEQVPSSCVVVLDEAYHEFVDSPAISDPLPLLDRFPNLAVLRTFSKAHALAALRVGYVIAQPDVIDAIDRTLVPFAVNGLGQRAALASLAAIDEMRERVDAVMAERRRVATELRNLGWSVPDSQANFVWLPAGDAAATVATSLERLGVVTRPFDGVGVRVTVTTPEEDDRFLDAFEKVTTSLDPSAWRLPTGDLARRVQRELDDLDNAVERLRAHAAAPAPASSLTEPDPPTGEQWDTGQVWAHLAEFGSYWLPELRRIVDHDGEEPVRFGRTKKDPHRIAAIERDRSLAIADHLDTARRDVACLAAELAQLDDADWTRTGVHPTLGEMGLWKFLHEFGTGHYHQHADQLDALAR
ncbi:MAG TPA: histidinol-phosphate transaminase, partial [Ilumatobacteraceae bacterium]